MSGYELNRAFKDSLSFFWQAKSQQIYRELDAMEQKGWLTSELVFQSDKPNKRVYSLTDAGKQELLHWLSEPEADVEEVMRVKSAFLMRVFFAGETEVEESLALLRAYRDRCLASGEQMKLAWDAIAEHEGNLQNDAKTRYWKMTALYGEKYYQAGIVWADEAIAILKEEM
jgi:DNA-binding PadR family transcriptional regulator